MVSEPSQDPLGDSIGPSHPARRLRRAIFAVSVLLTPPLLLIGTMFNPAIGGVGQGAANIAANAAANPSANQIHLGAFIILSFVLPISALGLSELAMDRSPWLATVGGGLGLVGWLPWAALTAQDDLTFQMAQMGGHRELVNLWNRFTGDATMVTFLLVYVACHLFAYVVLGVALARTRAVPSWAAWAFALTSPLTVAAFPTHQQVLLFVVVGLFMVGSIPAAAALWPARSATRSSRTGHGAAAR